MASSRAEIQNSALRKLGAERITVDTDTNTRARLVRDSYPLMRDKVLRSHPWKFAISYQELAQVSPQPDDVFDYDYVYQLPSDCLRVLSTDLPVDSNWTEIEGGRIACNSSTLIVKFIKRIEDVSAFDANFCEVLSWEIAVDIAYALTQSSSAVQTAEAGLKKAIGEARSYSAQIGSVTQVNSSGWLDARRR